MNQRILLVTVFTGVLLALTGVALIWKKSEKTAFIYTEKVYNEFKYKKELEQQINKSQEAKSKVLDSIMDRLRFIGTEIETRKLKSGPLVDEYRVLDQMYGYKQRQFEEEGQELQAQYADQIWKRLNTYMKEYGKENGYDYIFGVHGQGNVMYGGENKDLSEELLEYVNQRYEGEVKK